MNIHRFYATGFRNIESCDISFTPGVNLLFGMNAQGKTNVVEGIYIFSRGRSFRSSDEKELVRLGSEGFRIGIDYSSSMGEGNLEYAVYGRERVRKKNGYKVKGVQEMLDSFRAVLFSPDDLELVKRGPEERRAMINVGAASVYPGYISDYQRYKNALENRNGLLKLISRGMYVDRRELTSWSTVLAEYAASIFVSRMDYIRMLEKHTGRIDAELSSGRDRLTLGYKSDIFKCESLETDDTAFDKVSVTEKYHKVFTEQEEREIAAGVTLFGPHRDDLLIGVNNLAARSFASQGQQRSAVLSVKLAEGEVIREVTGEYPVFLFDDVLSELDELRRGYVIEGMHDRQIIITSCESDELQKHAETLISVEGGKYVSSRR